MKTEKLLSEILSRELSAESLYKLCNLYDFIVGHKEHEQYARLFESISQDETIQLIFRLAKEFRENKLSDHLHKYCDNMEVMTAFGISKRTLTEWRSAGILPYTVYRNKYFYKIEDLEELLLRNYIVSQEDIHQQDIEPGVKGRDIDYK